MSSSFGGEHMSTAAVPPSIGSDCVLANSLPGSRANSEASELSCFSQNERPHSTWFTCVARFSLSWRPFTLDTWCPVGLFYLDKRRWWGWNTQHADLWLEWVWQKSLRWQTHRSAASAQPCSDDARQEPSRQVSRSYFCRTKYVSCAFRYHFFGIPLVQKERHDSIKYHAAATCYCQHFMTVHENN